MIQDFIIFYLVFWWVMGILYKDNKIHNRLEELGNYLAHQSKDTWQPKLAAIMFLLISGASLYLVSNNIYLLIPFAMMVLWVLFFREIGKLILGFSQCKFCLENHVSTILAVSYYCYCEDIRVLLWGILCTSINYWLREFMR